MLGEDILIELDATLTQLIKNAQAIKESSLTKTEHEHFEKMQESLLIHLIHMDELLAKERERIKIPKKGSVVLRIQEKLLKFNRLNKKCLLKKEIVRLAKKNQF